MEPPKRTESQAPPPPTAPQLSSSSGNKAWFLLIIFVMAGAVGWWWYENGGGKAFLSSSGAEASAQTIDSQVLVDARPWGRIESVIDSTTGEAVELPKGSPFTPRLFELPAGSYEIAVAHPKGGTKTCSVEAGDEGPVRCVMELLATDSAEYFEEAGW